MHSIEVPCGSVESTQSRRQAEVEALGSAIRAERNAAGLSLDGLGQRVGIHRNTVSLYELGKMEVPFGTLVDIADALGMSVSQLARSGEERLRREAARSAEERPKGGGA